MFLKQGTGSTGVTSCPRACERVESFMLDNNFGDPTDVERVRQLYADTHDIDAAMRLAIQIKCALQRAKEAA